ncbi:TcpQ domain-containing protein [Burkholderia vietnamiensis]|uniref:TcpQ domain-containing protein n=1 Tax=Burkholderia vietnamiensis TaxID=60552 RepID=UPI001CF514A9|nr:TcpQ domain-containing protein [Burkholderia vietnamiensis]MCA8197394.1 toxin co-regulated pilus biosynthesis Q family protein [Burkholderia vietnamiensis]
MKTGFLKAVGLLLVVGFDMPLIAHAGFQIDPALQANLDGAAKPAAPSMVAAAAPDKPPVASPPILSPTAPAPAPLAGAAVGAAIAPAAVAATALPAPSAAWNTPIQGFGRHEPLRQALSHVIPVGGQLVLNGTLPTKRVSWDGSSTTSRMTVARKMLADAGIGGVFSGDNLVVNVEPAGVTANVAASAAPTDPGASFDPATVPRQWTIPKGVMLSDGLADWIEQTGAYGEKYQWSMDWKAYNPLTGDKVDYPVPAPLHFHGTIDQVAGQLIWLYRNSKAPLHIDISKEQRFIHISLRGN